MARSMASGRGRGRTIAQWVLTFAVLALVITDWGTDQETTRPTPNDEPGGPSTLVITSISEADVSPGDAVVVGFDGADPMRPVEATIARRTAEIVVRGADRVVVRIPHDTSSGKAGLRIVQGDKRSKAWDLQVHPTKHKKLIGRVLGGLALFVFGLGLVAAGLRGLAGHRVRTLLARWTRSTPQALVVGVLVGGVTQLTTSAAAFALGLVEARLLAIGPAVAILVGAQLGASVTGALLPVALASESLLVITIGVIWMRLATGRRGAAIAKLLLGAGLMLYGLHLLQTGVQPLVGDPKLLPYVAYLRDGSLLALLACATAGAVLALLLQGPGPVYVLVLGLVQTSGVIPVGSALAILAGTNLGAAVGMALIAWQSGRRTRPLIAPQLAFGLFATLFALAIIPLWATLAPDVDAIRYGQRVVRPDVSGQLALGFAITQIAAVAMWLAVLPALARRAARRPTAAVAPPVAPDAHALQRDLVAIFACHQAALDAALAMSCTGDRAVATDTDLALSEGRRALEAQHGVVVGAGPEAPPDRMSRSVVAILQLQRQVEQLVAVADLGVERGLRLTDDERARLRRMHALASDSYAVLSATVEDGVPPDVEAAGAREIQMNVLEAEGRASSVVPKRSESAAIGLGLAELVDTYEHVGNHLFRVCKSLADEPEELA